MKGFWEILFFKSPWFEMHAASYLFSFSNKEKGKFWCTVAEIDVDLSVLQLFLSILYLSRLLCDNSSDVGGHFSPPQKSSKHSKLRFTGL